jgi:hypothetical protein
VNLFQRLIGVWWSLWAAARGLDMTRAAPLPEPVIPPTLSGAALIAQAEARGTADGRSAMVDPWSFGGAGEEESEDYDLDYVRGLRHQREAALLSLRTAQRLTDDQVSVARRRRDEARDRMAVAQERMSGLATDEEDARLRGIIDAEDDITAPVGPLTDPIGGHGPTDPANLTDLNNLTDPADPADPVVPDARTPWEGESSPLPFVWRLLILIGLAVAQMEVEFSMFQRFLGSDPGAAGTARWLAAATSGIVVFGPFVAGTVLRTRAATGTDRRIGYAILALVLSWLAAVVALGLVRARIFQAGTARPDTAHITFATVVVMFIALSLVVGAMAFMIGLARRHPYQEAYLRQRARRDRFETVMRIIAGRINPGYLDPDNGAPATGDQERAITEAYAAAENAYYAALAQAHGDPAFTEAIQHRRGLRTPA